MEIVEKNAIIKKWNVDMIKIALVYPNRYSAMSGLTIQTLYSLFNSFPNVLCERFFLPSPLPHSSFNIQHKGLNNPPLRSIENGITLDNFDICAFSVCYELDFSHIYWILDNANIPYKRELRQDHFIEVENNDEYQPLPLIIMGGPVIRSNPLPLSNIYDIAFIGEIEPIIEYFLSQWEAANIKYPFDIIKRNNAFFKKISTQPGFFIPEIHDVKNILNNQNKQIERVYVKDIDSIPHPIHQIIPLNINSHEKLPFGEAVYIEVNRGCPYKCHFCMTGNQLKPFRNRSLEKLKQIISDSIKSTGVNKVVLIGSSIPDHPHFSKLCEFLISKDLEFSIPSVRIDTINPKIAELLSKSGMKTIAIAPETGNDGLRKKLNKFLTNRQIINGSTLLLDAGIPHLKLYMIYGFPFEHDTDALSIAQFTEEIANLGFQKRAVRLSLNPFIPKSHTPFETFIDNYMDHSMKILKNRESLILDYLEDNIRVKIQSMSLKEAYIQSIFSLGDGTIHPLIDNFYQLGYSQNRWYKSLKKGNNKEIVENLFTQIKSNYKNKSHQPWDFIDQH